MIISPLEQFSIVSLLSFSVIGTNTTVLFISNFLVTGVIICGVLTVLVFLLLKKQVKIFSLFPIIFRNYYGFIITVIRENFIRKGAYFLPYIFLLMSFLLLANLFGMIPYSFALTSHFALTLFLSFTTFFSSVALGFQCHGLNFFSLFLPQGAPFLLAPFLIAVEFISYLARLFSLAIRLFANIMSGHTLLKILAGFAWTLTIALASLIGFVPFFVVFVITGLEIIIAFLQAYVFTVLSAIYLNEALQLH